jgi:adenosylmethionine-8-amino-7-oxononanoate aminotransferase
MYKPLLFDGFRIDLGDTDALSRVLDEHRDQIAAVIVEPLVQGAAGILVAPDGYLRDVRHLCDEHDVFLICDEVATGFGRTGTMFACEQEGVTPDFMTVAKGLTGGYLPLAATLTTERVYEGFLGEFHEFRTFFHGHTYTGNPLACAAALATLEVFEAEHTLDRLQDKIALLWRWLDDLVAPLGTVGEVRGRGFMVGIELAGFGLDARIGHQVTMAARRMGAIIRPLGDVIVLMPPLSIEPAELRRLIEITAEAIIEATGCAALPLAA